MAQLFSAQGSAISVCTDYNIRGHETDSFARVPWIRLLQAVLTTSQRLTFLRLHLRELSGDGNRRRDTRDIFQSPGVRRDGSGLGGES